MISYSSTYFITSQTQECEIMHCFYEYRRTWVQVFAFWICFKQPSSILFVTIADITFIDLLLFSSYSISPISYAFFALNFICSNLKIWWEYHITYWSNQVPVQTNQQFIITSLATKKYYRMCTNYYSKKEYPVSCASSLKKKNKRFSFYKMHFILQQQLLLCVFFIFYFIYTACSWAIIYQVS